MKSRPAGYSLCFVALALLPAVLLLPRFAEGAAKSGKGAKAARSAKAKSAAKSASKAKADTSSSSDSKPSAAATPYEVPSLPSSEASPATPAADTKAKPAEPSPSASTSEEPKKETPPAASSSEPTAVPEATPPVVEEPPPPPPEPMPLYVEHLGPDSYPGKLRGLHGGSMWLEPSFHGLQWPYMAKSGLGVSGVFWVDSGYEQISRDDPSLVGTSMYLQQGRAVLRVTPTYTNGRFFIQGQVELVGNVCQASSMVCINKSTVDTDDLWIRVGQWNAWDLKVGRFEAWELYHTGMGLDINTQERLGAHNLGFTPPADLQAPDFYGMNWLHDRPTAGLGVGYLAFHAYPSQNLRFEVLGELGADDNTSQGYTYLGGRPSFILDQGWVKVKVGAEYEKRAGDTQYIDASTGSKQDSKAWRSRKGVGGGVQFVIDPWAEFGGNFAFGWQDNHENPDTGDEKPKDSFSRNSVGGFGNLRLGGSWLLGGGVNFTWQNNKFYYQGDSPSPDYTAHMQAFGAVQYLLAGQLYIRAVIGYARADFVASDQSIDVWSNSMYSGRLRLMYLF